MLIYFVFLITSMSRIARRNVKGNTYYYLEESFLRGGKLATESAYLGRAIPDSASLLKIFREFKARLERKGIRGITPPFTEFITRNRALKLAKALEQKRKFLASLSSEKRAEFVKRERITFITDSNAIEGSTLDYYLTNRVISDQKRIERLQARKAIITGMGREEQEALNLNKCLDLYETLLARKADLREETILRLHFTLLSKIEGYEKYRGVWRPVNVMIRGSEHVFSHHSEVPRLMHGLLEWYRKNEGLIHPVELAAKFHTKFTAIHPFADGNGRMARLLMNYILQLNGFPFTNIPLKRRSTYMRTQAAGNEDNHKPFARLLTEEIIKQNKKLGE
jgi:Fic family protein